MKNNYKFLLYISTVLISIALLTHTQAHVSKTNKPKNFNPSNTIIATDLDEVVIFGRESGSKWWFANLLHPSRLLFGYKIKSAQDKYALHDAFQSIDKVVEDHPSYKDLAEEYKKVLIKGTVNKKTIRLYNSLKEQGFTIIPASNITKGVYKSLVTNKVLPSSLFSTDTYFIKTKKCNKKSDGSYFKKPNVQYFKNLQDYIQKKLEQPFEHIIFIDDKKENVQGAKKAGIIALHFKNPKQLQRKLEKKMGITL